MMRVSQRFPFTRVERLRLDASLMTTRSLSTPGTRMERKSFVDVFGMEWDVWEVYPRLVERRLMRERRAARRESEERRHVVVGRPTLPRQILAGWLAFQSRHERRRLADVPDEWEELTDRELQALLVQSTLSSKPRRPIA